jgi:putative ABC transport system permease protein
MPAADFLRFVFGSIAAHRLRSFLTALGICVGIAAVIVLTSIGAGLQQFVTSEFTQFGTNFININPGKVTTQGMSVGVFGSVRPLSLEDAEALRRVPQVLLTNAGVIGNAEVSVQGRARRVTVFGSGPDFLAAFKMELALGEWLPHDELGQARAFAVLGPKVQQELFGAANPLGSRIAIGGYRYRVIGVIRSKGNVLGWDFDDCVYIPSARALELFNREGLMEIHVVHDPQADVNQLVERVRQVLVARHGREDFTITPQQKMLDTLNSVLQVLTFAVGALGGISLVVGGVGILTIMTIAVAERTVEIGLLRALGAPRKQVLMLFLAEATLLAAAGGFSGLALGFALAQLLHALFLALPVNTPWLYAVLAELIAVSVGLAAGVAPAGRASRLDPVEALRAE